METLQQKGILTVVIVALFVLFLVVVTSKNNQTNSYLSSDPIMARRAEILALASPEKPLTSEVRSTLFQYLSGPQLLRYNFTPAEKTRIINFLNKK